MSVCDIINNWDRDAFSGDDDRFEKLRDLINEIMEGYGFNDANVEELPGLIDSEGSSAMYDVDDLTIYIDPDYLASDETTPDEAIQLAAQQSILAMDDVEDSSIDLDLGELVEAAWAIYGDLLSDCFSAPESGGDGDGDTGGW